MFLNSFNVDFLLQEVLVSTFLNAGPQKHNYFLQWLQFDLGLI